MRVTDEMLLNAERKAKIYKIYDGKGLYAEIPPSGNIRWRWKFTFEGKENKFSVGIYPEVSLEEARVRHKQLYAFLKNGLNPSECVKEMKAITKAKELEQDKIKKEQSKLKSVVKLYEKKINHLRLGIKSLLDELQYE